MSLQNEVLSDKEKSEIDSMSVYGLLHRVRFGRLGDPAMQGVRGDYWLKRLAELRSQDNDAYVRASKDMGWER